MSHQIRWISAFFLILFLQLFPGIDGNLEEVDFHGLITADPWLALHKDGKKGGFEARPIVWHVKVKCAEPGECLVDEYETETESGKLEEVGKFLVRIELMPEQFTGQKRSSMGQRRVSRLLVTAQSREKLGGLHRSFTWQFAPDFDSLHIFRFGHLEPVKEGAGLFLRVRFSTALELPTQKDGHPLFGYVAKVTGSNEGEAMEFGIKDLVEGEELKGRKGFEIHLNEKVVDYLKANQKPRMNFLLIKLPFCEKCHLHQSADGQEMLLRAKKTEIYMHTGCHEKFAKKFAAESSQKGHNKFIGKYFYEGDIRHEEHIFEAKLEMPILQNGRAPFYHYEFDPNSAPAVNYNHVQKIWLARVPSAQMHVPSAQMHPGRETAEASSSSGAAGRIGEADVFSTEDLELQNAMMANFEAIKLKSLEAKEKEEAQERALSIYGHYSHYFGWLDDPALQQFFRICDEFHENA